MLSREQCWQAVLERDAALDGLFVFGVLTTGIFCRPSCAARRPKRENVRFFESPADAERHGLRPCKRCRPLEAREDDGVAKIRELCEFIRTHCDSGDPLTLEVLAAEAELSLSQLRRMFKRVVGVTPRQFVESCRFEALRGGLRQGDEVTRAIYDAGFGSSSPVYEKSTERLGMTPSQYRAGGAGLEVVYAVTSTPFGRLLVATTEKGLCFVALGATEAQLESELERELPKADRRRVGSEGSPLLAQWLEALERHLGGYLPHLDLPLDVRATAFQERVWRYLRTVPYGETRTYAEVAAAVGRPRAARAVGAACAANPVALAVPCHRVVRSGGGASGYRWGEDRKRQLLEAEASHDRG